MTQVFSLGMEGLIHLCLVNNSFEHQFDVSIFTVNVVRLFSYVSYYVALNTESNDIINNILVIICL